MPAADPYARMAIGPGIDAVAPDADDAPQRHVERVTTAWLRETEDLAQRRRVAFLPAMASMNSRALHLPTCRARRAGAWRLSAAAALLAVSIGCTPLPPPTDAPLPSTDDGGDTLFGRSILPALQTFPGRSGFFALTDAREAFAARALLADAAERTLDVQYYIWHDDLSGRLLFDALLRAAQRGVRVRLLLDDNNTAGLDPLLAALDAHPNIEVRLFNPFAQRRWRWLGYLGDFDRLNRRMHNKSFTADRQVTIVGGRNIGDEYFDAGDGVLFVDVDVLAIGPIVGAVADDFDRYWTSRSSYALADVLRDAGAATSDVIGQTAASAAIDPAAEAYLQALHTTPFVRELLERRLPLEWATARLVTDDPAKGLGRAAARQMLPARLRDALGMPQREIRIVSPYFVPTAAGVDALAALARSGVRVQVLTNAPEATDVAIVHAGYAKRRRALLEAGVALFELKRDAGNVSSWRPTGVAGVMGRSAASLHAKTFAVDGERVFVGSFNFDPRSANLNTELGVVIDSVDMAATAAHVFREQMPLRAYEVRIGSDGRLQWVEQRPEGEVVHDVEPGTHFLQRAAVRLLALLPIEWLL